MTTLSKKIFGAKLKNLKDVIELIDINQYNVGTSNVDILVELTKQYTKLSSIFNNYTLTDEQTRSLKAVRDLFPRETRNALNKKIKGIIEEREKKAQKIEVEVEKRNQKTSEAQVTVRALFPRVHEAAKKCLEANTSNIEELVTVYKSLSAQLRQAIDSLNAEERLDKLHELTILSRSVNQHKIKMDELDRQNFKAIKAAVRLAREKVSQMTVEDLILSLLGPKQTRNVLGVLDMDSSKLVKINDSGSLILADLSKDEQNALAGVLIKELSKISSSSHSSSLAKLVKAIEKDIDGLMTGEKTHLSILYEDKGVIGSVHIDILDLLKNPEGTIETLFYSLYKQGLSVNAGVVMTVTSPTEVNALLQLDSLNLSAIPQIGTLQELTGQIVKYATNPQALAQIVNSGTDNKEVNLIQRKLVQASNRRGLEAGDVVGFIKSMATLLEAKRILVSTPTNSKELGLMSNTKSAGGKGAIEYVNIPLPHNVKSVLSTTVSEDNTAAVTTSASKKIEAAPVELDVAEVKPDIKLSDIGVKEEQTKKIKKPAQPKIDLSVEYIQFYSSLRKLADIYEKLSEKGRHGNTNYQNTAEKVLKVYVSIKDAGESFFANPDNTTFINFSDVTFAQIKSIDPVLQEHRGNQFGRGILTLLNGLLGVIAALTVIPALIIEATSNKGYAGTFFTSPETESAKAFKYVKRALIDQGINIETKVIGPCTPGK